jgi:hypothetical protein
VITTAEDVECCVTTAAGCLYEEDNETYDADEDKRVVTVDDAYIARHLPTITQRLTQAGVCLGALLNRALGGSQRPSTSVKQSLDRGDSHLSG